MRHRVPPRVGEEERAHVASHGQEEGRRSHRGSRPSTRLFKQGRRVCEHPSPEHERYMRSTRRVGDILLRWGPARWER